MDKVDFRRLDLGQLLIFSELLELRKTTAVAERLSLSQSTISHALGRLREVFGEQLFIRSGSVGLEPTTRALEIAPTIEKMLTLAGSLGGSSSYNPQTASSHFRITGTSFTGTLLAPILTSDLKEHAPHTTYSYSAQYPSQCLESLSRNDSDIAIIGGDETPGYNYTHVFTDTAAVVLRANHPKSKNGEINLDTYLSLEHLNLAPDGALSGEDDKILNGMNEARHVVAAIADICAAFKIVSTSDLALTVPRTVALPYTSNFSVNVFPCPTKRKCPLHAVRHARTVGDASLDWLTQRILIVTHSI